MPWGPGGKWEDSRFLAQMKCEDPEAHEAHMRLNGECPWCDAPFDEGAIDPNMVICEAHGNPDCGLCE